MKTGVNMMIGFLSFLLLMAEKNIMAEVEDNPGERWAQVELPGQEGNVIKTAWPGIGCWFWKEDEFRPGGYKAFIDLHAERSGFTLLTTSIRHPVEVTDPSVHDQIKAATEYARSRGFGIVMDLDVRLARKAFMAAHPDEMQEIVRVREVPLSGAEPVIFEIESLTLGDHYTFRAEPYRPVSGRLLRVYSYFAGTNGIEPDSVKDITGVCEVIEASDKRVRVKLPADETGAGRKACVMAAFSLFTPDVFAPHLDEFQKNILRQYSEVPLAGACKDEWGFPGRFGPRADDLWFSKFMARAYAERRPGRDLARDFLLMALGEKGREGERIAAINHYMEMCRLRNGEHETRFYCDIKEIFGPQAMSATHPTWYPFPTPEEVFKNGLDWWICRRDLAQTDEVTPFCARTALAKKWRSPLWYNMYYDSSPVSYEEDVWRHALGGGRINFHPPWPPKEPGASLLNGNLLRADCRIRLLNYISTAPIDCPIAVVFGHARALNWEGPGLADAGIRLTNALWEDGFYADLIPSSEIENGSLTISDDGAIQYGPQKYAAVILHQPQYERPRIAEFFRKAASRGKSALFRVGEWTVDFEGRRYDAESGLPPEMKTVDGAGCAKAVIEFLQAKGIEPQTRCSLRGAAGFLTSMMPEPSGRCRLLDGTIIIASGAKDVMGDPISEAISSGGHEARFDAVGIAAVRFSADGGVEAMAAGGLKSFACGAMRIELPERVDVALWREADGHWRGILQDCEGEIPEALKRITDRWTRLRSPALR
ncbi:MAG TPA: hypothetical protein PL033_21085 [Candidatus Brocadiia bacterium]|nr:hypothetical protein [Candidatus Brocadiia bacterium]